MIDGLGSGWASRPEIQHPNLSNITGNETTDSKFDEMSLGKKLLRGEAQIGAMQVGMMVPLLLLPIKFTKWSPRYKANGPLQNIVNGFKDGPVFDHDPWTVNYVAHPVVGAMYYNTLRSQGATPLQSFLFSVFQSTMWEYIIEGTCERPSIQDLLVTPIVGSFIGEISYRITEKMRERGFKSFGSKVLVTIINPSYVLNRGYH